MNIEGINANTNGFPFLTSHTVAVHNETAARVWFAHAKYLQIMLKSIVVKYIPIANKGIAMKNLFFIGACLILKISAIINLDPLKAVSPEVIGQATTPSTARNAPKIPSN